MATKLMESFMYQFVDHWGKRVLNHVIHISNTKLMRSSAAFRCVGAFEDQNGQPLQTTSNVFFKRFLQPIDPLRENSTKASRCSLACVHTHIWARDEGDRRFLGRADKLKQQRVRDVRWRSAAWRRWNARPRCGYFCAARRTYLFSLP